MKRIAIIIGAILLLVVGFMWAMYTVRKSKINDQYVSRSSTSILSLAVDDLLLDNISSLLPWSNKPVETEQGDAWIKKMIWNAGISIPARIHLFSMTPQAQQLYGILAIKNYDDCFSFFANLYPEGVNFIDKERGVVSVTVNKHINVVFDHRNLVYKIAFENNADVTDLQSLLLQPHTWTKIGSFEGFEDALSKKHISYVQKDKRLIIEATVTNHKTEIDGKWVLSQNLDDNFLIRNMDTTNQTVTFWSLLPLDEIPLLSYFMNKYTGFNQEELKSKYSNYFDLQMKTDVTTQRDSSISYVYDDDFNAIEEIRLQERTVPSIIHSWKYSKSLEESLPTKMFYKFRKKRIGQYLLNTTLETFPHQAPSQQTLYPLYFFIDFETWPETWSVSLFKKLKEDKVSATIMTTLQHKNELSINGQITY